jgi:plastocyanin
MLKFTLAIAILVAAALAQNAKQSPAPSGQATMQMGAFDYRPLGVTIKAGQTVRFINNSTYTHSVTDGPLNDPKKNGSNRADRLPAREKPFDSGDIEPQQTWEHQFNTPGTYRFHCAYHEKDGMSGVVTVVK